MQGKGDLIELLSQSQKKGGAPAFESKAAADRAITAILGGIEQLLSAKGSAGVTFVGFGAFKRVARKARAGVNPATGEKIKIKASRSVTFKAAKALKDALK